MRTAASLPFVCLYFCLCVVDPATAQVVDSGSDASDGELVVPAGERLVLGPSADGDNVYHLTGLRVEAGGVMRLGADVLGSSPVVLLVRGDVTIEGEIDADGADGHRGDGAAVPSVAGAGGWGGGSKGVAGNGPAGGVTGPGREVHGHHCHDGENGSPGYGNRYLIPLLGGSGGAGGVYRGGGAGGGALLIVADGTIRIEGTIRAEGGDAGSGGPPAGAGADATGAGSGGSIRLVGTRLEGEGAVAARGVGGPGNLLPGLLTGRIRLEAFTHAHTLEVGWQNCLTVSTPGRIFAPESLPEISLVRIDGREVPANPTGGFVPTDLQLESPGEILLEIVARNVPLGTVADVRVWSEVMGEAQVQSTPLAGDLAASTATAAIVLPAGYTRIHVQARWEP